MASNKDILDKTQEHYPDSKSRCTNSTSINMDQGLPQKIGDGESGMVRDIDFLLNDLMALRADPSRSTDWEWRDGLWAAVKAENENLRKAKEDKGVKKKKSSGSSHQTTLRDMYQRQQMTAIPRATRLDPIPRSQHEQIAAETSSRIPKPQTPIRPALKQKKASTASGRGRRVSFDIQEEEVNERRDTCHLQTSRQYSPLGQNEDNGQASTTIGSKSVRESLASLFNGKGYGKPTNIPMKAAFYRQKTPPTGILFNQNHMSPLNSSGFSIPTRSVTPTQLSCPDSVYAPLPIPKTPTRFTNHPNTMIFTNLDTQSFPAPSPTPHAIRPLQLTRGITLNKQPIGGTTLNQQPKRENMAPPPTSSYLPTGAAARTDSMKGRAYETAREVALKNASEVGYHRKKE